MCSRNQLVFIYVCKNIYIYIYLHMFKRYAHIYKMYFCVHFHLYITYLTCKPFICSSFHIYIYTCLVQSRFKVPTKKRVAPAEVAQKTTKAPS